MSKNTIHLWWDGTWRYSEEYSETCDAWKGDDYLVVDIPEDITYDGIDEWCCRYLEENFK